MEVVRNFCAKLFLACCDKILVHLIPFDVCLVRCEVAGQVVSHLRFQVQCRVRAVEILRCAARNPRLQYLVVEVHVVACRAALCLCHPVAVAYVKVFRLLQLSICAVERLDAITVQIHKVERLNVARNSCKVAQIVIP